MIKKYFSPSLLIISILLLLYTFYKSEIYWEGEKFYYYHKYYIISGALILLSIIFFFISEKFKFYLTTFFLSLIFALYLHEGYLIFVNPEADPSFRHKLYKEKTGKNYDTRTKLQVYKDIKKARDITVTLFPKIYLNDKNLTLMPLSGASKSETINCNENGYYSIFKSDRFGFNNPDEEWENKEIDYLIIGDSYAFGSCVNRPNDIASVLRKLSKKSVLNLSYPGNGPLIEYATLREYAGRNIKNILWLYFESNDNNDLYNELTSSILRKYIDDRDFTQDLKTRQNEVDKLVKSKLKLTESIALEEKRQNEEKDKFISKLLRYIKLYNTRFKLINQFYPKDELTEVLKQAKELSEEIGSNLYIVYIPGYARYQRYLYNFDSEMNKTFASIVKKLNINLIDINKEVFQNEKNPLELFPFKLPGHYNVDGYQKVAETIFKLTKN